jgi:hypothetical protein
MNKISADAIRFVKQAARDKISKLTDDEVGKEIRKFFDPNEPPPTLTQEQIDEIVDGWLGE